ncbi:hypothetical protein DPM19_15265 [Actinomadura craniellae]|uniref:TPM domain-containing protein n=1 Tax=Actinomadura craniellae TaxID=2231787 RepID=A0A365H5L5_9ACTN|nr:LPXTG cell wall anchor domain-containing protein [Actinomadura craniellae]RAY14328.1 hypothetical protein DPM19_15265 [Actinomadura craniellae]
MRASPLRARASAVLAAALVAIVALAGPARAETINPREVAAALDEQGRIYVHPKAAYLQTDAQLDLVRNTIERAQLPVSVMVLPAGAVPPRAQAMNRLLVDVYKASGRKSTYVLVVGKQVRAYSWALSPATTERVAAQAQRAARGNMNAYLLHFTRLAGNSPSGQPGPGPDIGVEKPIGEIATAPPPAPTQPQARQESADSSMLPLVGGLVAAVVVLGGAAFLLLRRKKKAAAAKRAAAAPAGPGEPVGVGAPQPGGAPGPGAAGPGMPGPGAPGPGGAPGPVPGPRQGGGPAAPR